METKHYLLVGAFLVLLIASGTLAVSEIGLSSATNVDESDHGYGLTYQSTTGCLDMSNTTNSGWLHVVSDGETHDLTFDATVHHGKSEKVNVTSDVNKKFGTYKILIDTVPADSKKKTSNCVSGTELQGGANVPEKVETIDIVVDGETVKSVTFEGGFAKLRQLPVPIETDRLEDKGE